MVSGCVSIYSWINIFHRISKKRRIGLVGLIPQNVFAQPLVR